MRRAALLVIAVFAAAPVGRGAKAEPPDSDPDAGATPAAGAAPAGTTTVDFSDDPGGQIDLVEPTAPPPAAQESLLPERFARGAALADPEPAPPPGRGPWPYVTLTFGGAALVTAGVLTFLAIDAHSDADALPQGPERDSRTSSYRLERNFAIGAGVVGLGAIGAGMYLLRRPHALSSATVAATRGGATVGWTWAL